MYVKKIDIYVCKYIYITYKYTYIYIYTLYTYDADILIKSKEIRESFNIITCIRGTYTKICSIAKH